MKLRLSKLPTALDHTISYLLFAVYFTVTSFEYALLEAASRLAKFGLGRILVKLASMFAVDRRAALQEALKKSEYQPLTIAYLDEQAGIDRRVTLQGLENAIQVQLNRCVRQVDTFVAIVNMVLLFSIMSLLLPVMGMLLGAGTLITLSYIVQILSLALLYIFQISGLTLGTVTEFPRTDYLLLLMSVLIGAVTYLTTGNLGISCIVIGVISLLLTFRNYMKHIETLRSLPIRVRYSFNQLMSGNPIYYPPKIENTFDNIFETIHKAAQNVGTIESISLTYRLVDHVLNTLNTLRSTMRMMGLVAFGVMVAIVGTLHWMFTGLAILGHGGVGIFKAVSITALNRLLAFSLAVSSFITGKIIDNEHLGLYMQLIAGMIVLTILHV